MHITEPQLEKQALLIKAAQSMIEGRLYYIQTKIHNFDGNFLSQEYVFRFMRDCTYFGRRRDGQMVGIAQAEIFTIATGPNYWKTGADILNLYHTFHGATIDIWFYDLHETCEKELPLYLGLRYGKENIAKLLQEVS
jgi:hypothetical protein